MLGQGLIAVGPSSESLPTDLSTATRGPNATGSGALGAPHAARVDSAEDPFRRRQSRTGAQQR
jgi:hypothetical protein